jgi:hypothetical protein
VRLGPFDLLMLLTTTPYGREDIICHTREVINSRASNTQRSQQETSA